MCRLCRSARQRAAHFAVRRAVFVDEQEMFAADDRDERDDGDHDAARDRHRGRRVAGAVRLYPLATATGRATAWPCCPRRATARSARGSCASPSRTAGARGGARMVAMIQLPNVAFFESLGWQRDGDAVAFHGRPHQPMAIALSPNA